jgi:hypothetical protein
MTASAAIITAMMMMIPTLMAAIIRPPSPPYVGDSPPRNPDGSYCPSSSDLNSDLVRQFAAGLFGPSRRRGK